MKVKKGLLSRRLLLSFVIFSAALTSLISNNSAHAAQITSRSLTLQAGASDGGSKPGGVVKHLFSFTIPSGGNVGSIQFQYCTTASNGTCTMPTGLVTTSATLGSESGATGTSIVNTTNGAPYLTRTAANVTAATAVTYRLDNITNPTGINQSFFVRISTYTAASLGGTQTDTGTVTASTATQIVLTGVMPESLIFCTGATISTTAGIPDCSTATVGTISFNQLFSPTDTATAKSQMAASTNATTGYSITVNGPTLTSGANTIPAMTVAATGAHGTGQFGMNLKLNTTATSTTPIGAEIAPASVGLYLKGQPIPSSGYDTVDTFKFASGDAIANSASGGAGPTNSQIYTSSYIVNVTGSQTAGTYTTTLTYICTPTF
jgi:hypothetical protein